MNERGGERNKEWERGKKWEDRERGAE